MCIRDSLVVDAGDRRGIIRDRGPRGRARRAGDLALERAGAGPVGVDAVPGRVVHPAAPCDWSPDGSRAGLATRSRPCTTETMVQVGSRRTIEAPSAPE